MAWKKERKAMMHAGMFFKLCPRSSSLACPNKHNPPVSNVAPLPLSSTVFTEARLKPHQFSSCHCTAPAISAFLARGRKYLLSKTRPPSSSSHHHSQMWNSKELSRPSNERERGEVCHSVKRREKEAGAGGSHLNGNPMERE